jgi:hypothetical protein
MSGAVRTTSSLHNVRNDTGRVAFCGPYVLSALTGYPISRVEEELLRLRALPAGCSAKIEGTYTEEVAGVLDGFGYEMRPVVSFMTLPRKERPTLWTWMQKPRNAWVHYILAIHKGRDGHWILVKGVKHCDTYTEGRWQFVCDGPHRGARVMDVFEVRRRPEA